ncbi:hypothetical protein [Paenibacillus polymyxa]|uniref:Uncharacterized protein n=1 Tax=Paenibacillus polymyxa (strain SC2) TaxID=886882 RepID=E3EL80_PAEPS|nr:hypothetical protein [Paenibacillus polymyxa]ADO59912.1 hypothetical protein PPSC2_28605 [Paenibacillus polymyxa SC2]WPQ59864.1 hypothetical protein SKN87_26620 [Paenibacillus polymyxa]
MEEHVDSNMGIEIKIQLKKEVRKILNKKRKLYSFLKYKYKEIGILPSVLLTFDVLHKLWLQESIPDVLIGELFGKSKKQISRLRSKYDITIKSKSYYLFMYNELLNDPKGIAKLTGSTQQLTRKEKRKLKTELLKCLG